MGSHKMRMRKQKNGASVSEKRKRGQMELSWLPMPAKPKKADNKQPQTAVKDCQLPYYTNFVGKPDSNHRPFVEVVSHPSPPKAPSNRGMANSCKSTTSGRHPLRHQILLASRTVNNCSLTVESVTHPLSVESITWQNNGKKDGKPS